MKYKVRITFSSGKKLLETFPTAKSARAYVDAVNGFSGSRYMLGAPKAEYLGNEKRYNEMTRRRVSAEVQS